MPFPEPLGWSKMEAGPTSSIETGRQLGNRVFGRAMYRGRKPSGFLAALLALVGAGSAVTAPGDAGLLTGAQFDRQMQQVVGATWSGVPLREALRDFCGAQRVAVLLDRRVDPGQELRLVVADVPLRQTLDRIAEDRGLGMTLVGPVVYFGPPEVAAKLRTLAALRDEEVRRLPPAAQRKFLLPEPLEWDDFATPRGLLEGLAQQAGLRLAGLEQVPHDLWAGAELPPISLVERLTLVAVQFDLTFTVSDKGDAVTLVPVPDEIGLVRSYPGGSRPQQVAQQYAALAPDARIKVVGSTVWVKALLEDHERLSGTRRPTPPPARPPPGGPGQTRIERFRVAEVPVGAVLESVCRRLGLRLAIDEKSLAAAGASLDRRVSVQVEKATVDELLEAIVRDTPLTVRRRGNVVEVRAE